MRKYFQSFFFLLPIFFLLFASSLLANDSIFSGDGATVYPVTTVDIQMVKEKVHIEKTKKGWKTEATFWFTNLTDQTVEVQVGFPNSRAYEPDFLDQPEETLPWTITDFVSLVDGKPTPTQLKTVEGREFGGAYLWKVVFKPKETKVLKSIYHFGGEWNSMGGEALRYILKTGEAWAGPIGEAEIVWELPKNSWPLSVTASPQGYIFEKDRITWYFTNFEPASDIDIGKFSGGMIHGYSPGVYHFETSEMAKKWIGEAKKSHYRKDVIALIRNGVFAKYGRPFKDSHLKVFFKHQNWYKENPKYHDHLLTPEDRAIVKLLSDYESSLPR